MNDDGYELTAEEAFSQLSPEERKRFGRMMKQEGRKKRDVDFKDVDDDDDDDDAKYDNPKQLGQDGAAHARRRTPGCSATCSRASAAPGALERRHEPPAVTRPELAPTCAAMSALKKIT